ncbi:MAG: ABC transporter ATP-binding protein [Balneolaceae bacterium]
MRQSPVVLRADHVSKSYPSSNGKGELIILNQASLEVKEGEIVAIAGPSGSGKSTLLHILGGLDRADSGSVSWGDLTVDHLDANRLADERNHRIGFVFQFHHLLPEFTALENVMMPALIGGAASGLSRERAHQLLARFGLEERANHRPSMLSGGEQQRVSIARALMNRPPVILADEPTGNLDQANTEVILNELIRLRDETGVAMVLITHEREIAARCDSIYELRQGALASLKASH